jgi:hypothetical protein
MSDQEFLRRREEGRNVVLYGNASTNSAWKALLKHSPVDIREGKASIGSSNLEGASHACLFVWRPTAEGRLVAGIGGTGLSGMRATTRLPYFMAGVGYPDFIVYSTGTLLDGVAHVEAAGYYGPGSALPSGDVTIR